MKPSASSSERRENVLSPERTSFVTESRTSSASAASRDQDHFINETHGEQVHIDPKDSTHAEEDSAAVVPRPASPLPPSVSRHAPSLISELPLELLLLIFDYAFPTVQQATFVKGEWRTLLSCTLVCRGWRNLLLNEISWACSKRWRTILVAPDTREAMVEECARRAKFRWIALRVVEEPGASEVSLPRPIMRIPYEVSRGIDTVIITKPEFLGRLRFHDNDTKLCRLHLGDVDADEVPEELSKQFAFDASLHGRFYYSAYVLSLTGSVCLRRDGERRHRFHNLRQLTLTYTSASEIDFTIDAMILPQLISIHLSNLLDDLEEFSHEPETYTQAVMAQLLYFVLSGDEETFRVAAAFLRDVVAPDLIRFEVSFNLYSAEFIEDIDLTAMFSYAVRAEVIHLEVCVGDCIQLLEALSSHKFERLQCLQIVLLTAGLEEVPNVTSPLRRFISSLGETRLRQLDIPSAFVKGDIASWLANRVDVLRLDVFDAAEYEESSHDDYESDGSVDDGRSPSDTDVDSEFDW